VKRTIGELLEKIKDLAEDIEKTANGIYRDSDDGEAMGEAQEIESQANEIFGYAAEIQDAIESIEQLL
jgi:methyl-accepting chemotaxis protein